MCGAAAAAISVFLAANKHRSHGPRNFGLQSLDYSCDLGRLPCFWLFFAAEWSVAERRKLVVILVLFLASALFWSLF